jgi:hypothetical protein
MGDLIHDLFLPVDQKVDTVCHRLANLLKLPLDTESKVGELYKRDTEENIDEELTSITSISPDITEQNDGNAILTTIDTTLEAYCHQKLVKISRRQNGF